MLPFLLYCIEAGLSGYVLFHASISIPNLQKWEDISKKAAKRSSTAANELQMTRKTQAAGAVAGLLSTLSAAALGLHLVAPGGSRGFLLNVGCAAATTAASVYIGGHWDGKANIPFVSSYNDALRSTKTIRGQLALVSAFWMATSLLALLGLIF